MNKKFWQDQPKPIIGLAPMDGYSDSAFRRVCKEVNPNIITVTEFTSADGLHFSAEKLKRKLYFDPSEQPVIAQIFGKNVDTFITATKVCEDMGFSGIDLNMGCPSKKVVRSEHGVALRKNPKLACQLIEAVANATPLPVSV
ncbi:MAG: tRNA-dihydrouridine synthase, partial [Candidatus Marinamargulisbacteria bacterium]